MPVSLECFAGGGSFWWICRSSPLPHIKADVQIVNASLQFPKCLKLCPGFLWCSFGLTPSTRLLLHGRAFGFSHAERNDSSSMSPHTHLCPVWVHRAQRALLYLSWSPCTKDPAHHPTRQASQPGCLVVLRFVSSSLSGHRAPSLRHVFSGHWACPCACVAHGERPASLLSWVGIVLVC